MNIASKKPKIKPSQMLILSEDKESFLLYCQYFFDQFKVQKYSKPNNKSEIIKALSLKDPNKLKYYITNPKNSQQLQITLFNPESNAEKILNKAKEISEKEYFTKIYCVFDYVFKHKHKYNHRQYNNIIPQKEALEKRKIYLINSVPSYEYWLLTHFKFCGKSFANPEELNKQFREATGIKYDDQAKSDYNLFNKIFQDDYKNKLKTAILNCKQQNQHNQQNQTPNNNPSSHIYEVVEYIQTFL